MTKFNVQLLTGLDVEVDQVKLWGYVSGEDFRDCFYDYDDLDDCLTDICINVFFNKDYQEWDTEAGKNFIFVEGFGKFYSHGSEFVVTDEEFGTIRVKLHGTHSDSVDEECL